MAADDRRDWLTSPFFFWRVPDTFLYALFRTVWRLRIVGLENVPLQGGVIFAGNHVANLDGPLIAIALWGRRYLRAMAKAELYSIPVLGWFLTGTGTIPVDRRGDIGAMRTAAAVLQNGGALGLLPEGTRSKDGRPGKPRAGVGFLAGLTKVPVVPVHLIGTRRWPWTTRVEARFGPPLFYEGAPDDREAALAFAQRVMDRVFSL